MRANYHTHTYRCNHASGTEEEYIQCALDGNIEVLGFSDHTPYFFPGDHYSSFRMRPNLLPDYVNTLQELRKKYQGKLDLHIGVEAEYYPNLFPELLPYLQDNGIEYMLLGQHYTGDEIGHRYCGRATDDPQVLKLYCRQTKDAMQLGLFTYFAHPDILLLTGDDKLYREEMRLLCREAKSCGMPLEYNLLGVRSGRNYPDPIFWELAAQEGCEVVLGVDAHDPECLNDPETEAKALAAIKTLGLTLVECPPIRKI